MTLDDLDYLIISRWSMKTGDLICYTDHHGEVFLGVVLGRYEDNRWYQLLLSDGSVIAGHYLRMNDTTERSLRMNKV
jgi:hypothetical protein